MKERLTVDGTGSKKLSSSASPESFGRTSSLLPDGSDDGLGGSVARMSVAVGDNSSFDVVGWKKDGPEGEGSEGSSEESLCGRGKTSGSEGSKKDLVPETTRRREQGEAGQLSPKGKTQGRRYKRTS